VSPECSILRRLWISGIKRAARSRFSLRMYKRLDSRIRIVFACPSSSVGSAFTLSSSDWTSSSSRSVPLFPDLSRSLNISLGLEDPCVELGDDNVPESCPGSIVSG
jgi:hypothetical protein